MAKYTFAVLLSVLFLSTLAGATLTLQIPSEVSACTCESFSYRGAAQNSRAPIETFAFNLVPQSDSVSAHVTSSLTLNSRQSGALEAYGTVACNALPGDYALRLYALGRESSYTAQTMLHVRDCSLITGQIVEAVPACIGGIGRFDVVLSNRGSASSTAAVSTDLLKAELSANQVYLAPGKDAKISIYTTVGVGDTTTRTFQVYVDTVKGEQVLVGVLNPRPCAQQAVLPAVTAAQNPNSTSGSNQNPALTQTDDSGALVVTSATATVAPSGISGLFAGAMSAWPWFLLVIVAVVVLYYALRDREFYNPFSETTQPPRNGNGAGAGSLGLVPLLETEGQDDDESGPLFGSGAGQGMSNDALEELTGQLERGVREKREGQIQEAAAKEEGALSAKEFDSLVQQAEQAGDAVLPSGPIEEMEEVIKGDSAVVAADDAYPEELPRDEPRPKITVQKDDVDGLADEIEREVKAPKKKDNKQKR